MLNIDTIVVTDFSQNARVVSDSEQKIAAVIDPGGDTDRILSFLEEADLRCSQIWLTHSHIDHCGGVASLIRTTKAKLYGHKAEQFLRSRVVDAAMLFGMSPEEFENCPEPDVFMDEGDTLSIGAHSFKVLFTPGHSPGHLSFYNDKESVVIAGDALFRGSVGRVDLPGGDGPTLRQSIKTKLLTLPRETRVLCGHGPDTTIGVEADSNPFILTEAW